MQETFIDLTQSPVTHWCLYYYRILLGSQAFWEVVESGCFPLLVLTEVSFLFAWSPLYGVITGKWVFTWYIDVMDLFLDCSQGTHLAAYFVGSGKERVFILTGWLHLGLIREFKENILKQIWLHWLLNFSEITFGILTWTLRKKFFLVYFYIESLPL